MVEVALIILCLITIFMLSLFESALVAASHSRLRALLMGHEDRVGDILLDWQRSQQYIASFVVGCNICVVTASALMTHLLRTFAPAREDVKIIGTLLMIAFILIFCEITPKSYGVQRAEPVVVRWRRLLILAGNILTPLTVMLTTIARSVLNFLRVDTSREHHELTDEEIMALLEVGEEEGILGEHELAIAEGIMRLEHVMVREVMVPRPDIVALPVECSVDEAVKVIVETGHSRIPLYEDTLDNIVGVIYAYDILSRWGEGDEAVQPRELMRTPLFVPETKKLRELMNEMRGAQIQIAIVIDEYGTTAGLVTLEDIVEQIVGELVDEHDRELPRIQQLSEGIYIVDARINRHELEDELDISLPDGDYDTLGGFIFTTLGRIPQVGERVELTDAIFIVEELQQRRVTKVRIMLKARETKSQVEYDREDNHGV